MLFWVVSNHDWLISLQLLQTVLCTHPSREPLRLSLPTPATGSSYKGAYVKNDHGLQELEWLEKLAEWRTAAAKAQNDLIISGGVTGTEVAGELATENPTVKSHGFTLANTCATKWRTST